MERYSMEWKMKQGAWVQDHKNEKWGRFYKLHYVQAGTEYSKGEYLTKAEADEALVIYKSASAMGRKGGSVKSEKKTAAVRENAKKPRPNRICGGER